VADGKSQQALNECSQLIVYSVVNVDLHPAFSKPAGHRGMEIFEDPETGKQQLKTYIKVMRYLNIPPSKSEAVRGQPEPLVSYPHTLDCSIADPLFRRHITGPFGHYSSPSSGTVW